MLKKIFLSSIAALFVFISVLAAPLSTPHAQVGQALRKGPWYFQGIQQWYIKVYDDDNPEEIFGERYTAAQVNWIIWSLITWPTTALWGPAGGTCYANLFQLQLDAESCLKMFSDSGLGRTPFAKENSNSNSSIGGLLKDVITDRPISSITYFKSLGSKLSLAPDVSAQSPGFGFGALDPVQGLWKSARDASYALVTVSIIVIAFMIMFRVKLSPQVVISAQGMIPKIVIALVLITFSYAIAGFLVDLMYVVIALVSILFQPDKAQDTFSYLTRGPVIGVPVVGDLPLGVFGILISYLLQFFWALMLTLMGGSDSVIGTADAVLGTITGVFVLTAAIVALVIFVLLIFIMFRIFATLFKAIALVLILTILAPFAAVAGLVIPGVGFSTWLKAYFANLMVFPVMGLFLLLAHIFLDVVVDSITTRLDFPLFTPIVRELTGFDFSLGDTGGGVGTFGDGWPPLLGLGTVFGPNLVFLGASLVILFMAPKASDFIKGIVQGRPTFGVGIGETLGTPGRAAATYGVTRGAERLKSGYAPDSSQAKAIDSVTDLVQKALRG